MYEIHFTLVLHHLVPAGGETGIHGNRVAMHREERCQVDRLPVAGGRLPGVGKWANKARLEYGLPIVRPRF
jgi:hypothetical protein